ncbi:MAG: T9SS type A sorting domain-containing protein, partial [Ignavibacteriales bacterium]|nr:T9SS type A sorting domain-containing protein [Ignavibacteriales bacterium]
PNPFNASTVIRYRIPWESHVRLIVYDILGNELQVIVNEVQRSGYKSIMWDAVLMPSGIYFYRLSASSIADNTEYFDEVRKLLLVK